MVRRHALALLIALPTTLAALAGCGGGENTNNAHTNANATVNANANNANAGTAARAKLDDALKGMVEASASFDPRPSMKLGEEAVLTFMISPKLAPAEIEKDIRQHMDPGKADTQQVKVGGRMMADLTGGDGFDINRLTEDREQVVATQQVTKWLWRARANQAGTQHLYLTLYAWADLGDGKGEQPFRVAPYNPRLYVVTVEAPPGGARPWLLLLPALLVPAGGVAAWLWLRGRKSRRGDARWFTPGAGEPRIFLSYRRDDAAGHAGRLRDALVERFGPGRLFMDLDSIRGGDDFVEALEKAVGSCAVVVVVIGRQWVAASDRKGNRRLDDPDDFVRREVEAALGRDVRVIPALVQEAEMPGADVLPASLAKLARRNAVEISDNRWDYDVGRLVELIEAALESAPAARAEASTLPG